MLSSLQQKLHCLLPFQLHFARLSLVTTTPLYTYHMKILIFSGIRTFHNFFLFVFTTPLLINAGTKSEHNIDHFDVNSSEIHPQILPTVLMQFA
jgi:hypothetical protein